jgi:2-C-methyl-D-erythritol 2,4-cyclodiphosphate synthase
MSDPARDAAAGHSYQLPDAIAPLPFRIGHGYDLHRLQPGGKLVLGGVVVAEHISPVAHSDGDVVIHAIVDALLGAMGWGDIGEWFPNTDERFRDVRSASLLDIVYNEVRRYDYYVSNVDVTVLAERPKLKTFKPQMIATLDRHLGGNGAIAIKAGTNEGCDAIGRGEAIAAHAVVLLRGDL